MSPNPTYRFADQSTVRELNLAGIMKCVWDSAPISRAALADKTGLNKTTVSSLVGELLVGSLLHEVGLVSAGTGRPGMLLQLNPAAGCIVAGEIGVDFISVICTNFTPEVIWRHQEKTSPEMGQGAILNRALALFNAAAEAGKAAYGCLLGVAVGLPGLVDRTSGELLFAPNLRWRDVPVRQVISEQFETRIFVDNEANLAAWGEHYFGAGRGHPDMIYISAGVGLGGGIIRNGQLFTGETGFAGEFGHMTVDPDGDLCNCGNHGCWETQVSQAAVFNYIRRRVRQEKQQSSLLDAVDGDLSQLTVPMVVRAARNGDAVACEALERAGHALGVGIASLVNALNPEMVIFGGILSQAADFLLPVVHEELKRRALRWNLGAAQVSVAQYGIDACVMGGVARVHESILAHPVNSVLC